MWVEGSDGLWRSQIGDFQLEAALDWNGFAYWKVISGKEDDLASGNVIDPEFEDGPEAPPGWEDRVLAIAKDRCARVAVTLSERAGGKR